MKLCMCLYSPTSVFNSNHEFKCLLLQLFSALTNCITSIGKCFNNFIFQELTFMNILLMI